MPPSPTPRVLSPQDVDLPIKEVNGLDYLPCYVFTETQFHAGDILILPDPKAIYKVFAPIEGTIVTAQFLDDSIGWEIVVRTPFVLNGETVYYDILHSSGLADNLRVGASVRKGDQLAVITRPYRPMRGFSIIDFAIRRGSHKMAAPTHPSWTGTEYVSVLQYVQDDLNSLAAGSFRLSPTCVLTSPNNTIPEAKRTPRP